VQDNAEAALTSGSLRWNFDECVKELGITKIATRNRKGQERDVWVLGMEQVVGSRFAILFGDNSILIRPHPCPVRLSIPIEKSV
jgi:hypothetical protein